MSPQRRLKIYFQDDAIYQRFEGNIHQLIRLAMEESQRPTSNNALLAKKALKYRNVYDRIAATDITSPTFDACEFMGVDWHKPSNLKKN